MAVNIYLTATSLRGIGSMIRIVDWNAVGAALLELVLCSFGAVVSNDKTFSTIMSIIAVIAFAALVQKLMGVVWDFQAGTVRFFTFWLPRRVAISDIRDANCEFGIPISPARLALGIFGQKGRRGRSEARQRTYMVNLSGSFGSRQIRFHHRRWRDRFLSILRDQAPRCRITRWF